MGVLWGGWVRSLAHKCATQPLKWTLNVSHHVSFAPVNAVRPSEKKCATQHKMCYKCATQPLKWTLNLSHHASFAPLNGMVHFLKIEKNFNKSTKTILWLQRKLFMMPYLKTPFQCFFFGHGCIASLVSDTPPPPRALLPCIFYSDIVSNLFMFKFQLVNTCKLSNKWKKIQRGENLRSFIFIFFSFIFMTTSCWFHSIFYFLKMFFLSRIQPCLNISFLFVRFYPYIESALFIRVLIIFVVLSWSRYRYYPVCDWNGSCSMVVNAHSSNHEPNQEEDCDPKWLSERDSLLCEQAQWLANKIPCFT